jgi:hypothetical protein
VRLDTSLAQIAAFHMNAPATSYIPISMIMVSSIRASVSVIPPVSVGLWTQLSSTSKMKVGGVRKSE